MRGRGHTGAPQRGSMTSLILIMLSFMACFYIGGRLWQDAETRLLLVGLIEKNEGKGQAVSVDETLKLIDCKDQKKRVSALEMELAAAKSQGFSTRRLRAENQTRAAGRLHVVMGINTGFGQHARRDSIRNTWMPKGTALKKLEDDKGVVIRFVVGRSANRGDSLDRLIDDENNRTHDFLILDDHVEEPEEIPRKAKKFFATAVETWDADFFLKVDDDVYVNIDKLGEMLAQHWDKPRIYIGCMKSGEVFSDSKQRWYEPEWWKFGDQKGYMRHAEARMYGVSRALAQYISINNPVLHVYRHEDVMVGSWMLGLDVEHVDERRLCCSSGQAGLYHIVFAVRLLSRCNMCQVLFVLPRNTAFLVGYLGVC
ncbi:glycosyltransferase-like protein [Selaginella moellendorffii]|uniref:Hexosyltransferase n=1 Tax=Selaginella moellendorffii TaxID=88036 RepID=D8RMA1_SELML|nr:glycosyltransferase-like protein [Selaginella moellendorffii]